MKKLLTLIMMLFMTITTTFCQVSSTQESWLGKQKYEILNATKGMATYTDPTYYNFDGVETYSIILKFYDFSAIYYFTSQNECFFYMLVFTDNKDNRDYCTKFLNKYDSRRTTYGDIVYVDKNNVYRWLVTSKKSNLLCIIYLYKEEYEKDRNYYYDIIK